MSVQTIKIDGTNEEGFVHLNKVRETAQGLNRDRFLETYPVPALFVSSLDAQAVSLLEEAGLPQEDRPQLLTVAGATLRPLRYMDRVAFLAKRPGNPFPHFVSLGRSANNDVVIALEGVSKLHGYFTFSREGWAYTDQSSTNGSILNGRRVEPQQRTPIQDKNRLKIGAGLTLQFLLPESLYQLVSNP